MQFFNALKMGQYRARQWLRGMFVYPQHTLTTATLHYDEYWDQKRPQGKAVIVSPAERDRAHIIAARLPDDAVTIGDVGSGPGVVLAEIIHARPKAQGIALDSSTRALDEAAKLGLETKQIDITTAAGIDAVPTADYYLILEVLEHIPNTEVVLTSLVSKATRGVFFSVPNTGFLVHRFRLLFGKVPAQWITMPNEHLRFWTIVDMRWWLHALGYTDVEIIPYRGVPFLNRLWPNLFAEGMVVRVSR